MSRKDTTKDKTFQLQHDMSHLTQHRNNPHASIVAASLRDAMGRNERALFDKAFIPQVVENSVESKSEYMFFVKDITTIAKAMDHFRFLENTYRTHVINGMGSTHEMTTLQMISAYVAEDPNGESAEPMVTDSNYWTSKTREVQDSHPLDHRQKSKRGKPFMRKVVYKVLTKVGTGVRWAQQQIYEYLRSSLRKYMKRATWDLCDAAIKQEESTKVPAITDANFLKRENMNRITWSWIKQWVLDTICAITLGSYHFMPVMTMHRQNAEARHIWMGRVRTAHLAVVTYKQGWQHIGCKDHLHKVWIWLSEDEQEKIRDQYANHSVVARRYRSDPAIIRGETLQQFITFVNSMNPNSFKQVTFKMQWCKKGLAQLYYTRVFVVKIMKERDDARSENKRLKDRVNQLQKNQGGGFNMGPPTDPHIKPKDKLNRGQA